MKTLRLLIVSALIGILVALVYAVFEAVVHQAIDLVWIDAFDTDTTRVLVLPLAIGLSVIYFGAQHHFDQQAEHREEHGLGDVPAVTPHNIVKVLGIGFLSLFAGASLGPEAVLVPASIMTGILVGQKIATDKTQAHEGRTVFAIAGFVALFTAFFNSFFVGLLSLFITLKQMKVKFSVDYLAAAAAACLTAAITLYVTGIDALARTPTPIWNFAAGHIPLAIVLVFVGVALTLILTRLVRFVDRIHKSPALKPWLSRALLAGGILGTLYLLGGPLVEFTGNNSIVPMTQQAVRLGFLGLVWLIVVKLAAIAWSTTIGYRGGLIFPMVFVAAVCSAIVHQIQPSFSFIIGLILVMVGALVANQKTRVLF